MKIIKTYFNFVNETNRVSKAFLQIYKNNNKADYYNYIILKGEELYNVRIRAGEKMIYKYIGKIDKKIYTINGMLVKKPSEKMIVILQNNLKPKNENS
jgi:hypothetical protein